MPLTSPAQSLQGFSPGGAVGKRVQTAPDGAPGRGGVWATHGDGGFLGWDRGHVVSPCSLAAVTAPAVGRVPALGSVLGAVLSASQPGTDPWHHQAHGLPLVTGSHQNKCQPSGPKTVMFSFWRSRCNAPPRISGGVISIVTWVRLQARQRAGSVPFASCGVAGNS